MTDENEQPRMDVGNDLHVEQNLYVEVECDCGAWVRMYVPGVESDCPECGQTWTLKAIRIDGDPDA